MQRGKDILAELQELSPILAGIEPVNVFSVPEGYFIRLNENILEKIKSEDISAGFLSTLPKSNLQEVPEGYFDTLSESILSRIKTNREDSPEDELKALAPRLALIEKNNVFTVPDGYFDTLSVDISKRIIHPDTAKIIGINQRKSWMRYAVAAVIGGIMFMSAWMIIDKPFASEGKKFLAEVKSIKKEYKTDEDIQNALATISDKDIIKYLEATGDMKDIELITPNINTNELPSEADYFDQKFLDSFINELESPKNIN